MSDQNKERYEQEEEDKGSDKGLVVLLALFFLPAMMVAGFFYALFRFGRIKISVLAAIALGVDLLALGYVVFTRAWTSFLPTLTDVGHLNTEWPTLLKVLLPVNLIIGSIFGTLLASWQVKNMQRNPQLTQLPGTWTYHFTFRRTPVELYKKRRIMLELRTGVYECKERSPLGLSESKTYLPVFRYASEARTHTLITGASGSGKSITLLNLIHNDIVSGVSVVAMDLKRDPQFASKLATWAEENGRNFLHFVNGDPEDYDIENSPGQATYDCLAAGSPGSKADMVLNMREYETSAALFKSNMTQILQVTFQMLKQADRRHASLRNSGIEWNRGGINLLASAVKNTGRLEALAGACEGTEVELAAGELIAGLKGKGPLSAQLIELQGQLRTITASDYGRWLVSGKAAKKSRSIDLFKETQKDTVILFSLNSDAEKDFVKYIGSLIMADLTNVSARRRNQGLKNPVHIYLDEFQALNPTSVAGLLEKSRASEMAVTLAQQSLEQVIAASEFNGEAYLNSIIDTCSNFIVHSGSTQTSAERYAKIIGQDDITKFTVSNNHSNPLRRRSRGKNQMVVKRVERDWKFSPERFMALSSPNPRSTRTTAIYITKNCADPAFTADNKPGAIAREVVMIPHQDVLEDYYTADHSKDVDREEEFIDDSQQGVPLEKEGISLKKDADEGGSTKMDPAKLAVMAELVEDMFEDEDYYPADEDEVTFEEQTDPDDEELSFVAGEGGVPTVSSGGATSFSSFEDVEETAETPEPVVVDDPLKNENNYTRVSSFEKMKQGKITADRLVTPEASTTKARKPTGAKSKLPPVEVPVEKSAPPASGGLPMPVVAPQSGGLPLPPQVTVAASRRPVAGKAPSEAPAVKRRVPREEGLPEIPYDL